MKELLIHHPLRLLVLLPSSPHFQALKKLDLLQDNSEWLKSLNIHMEFAVDCAIEDQNALQHYFDFPITINSHPYNEIAQSYGCIQSKPVFGTGRQYICPALLLFDQDLLLTQTHRINPSALKHILQVALKVQHQHLQKKLKKMFDTF